MLSFPCGGNKAQTVECIDAETCKSLFREESRMHTPLCETYEIETPIFAFSHSPAVIAAVSKAGGFGVLGAVGMEPEQLDQVLQMLSRECAGKSFGIDLIIPEKYVGREEGGLSLEALQSRIPQEHRDFLDRLLEDYHVPKESAPRTLSSRAGM